MKREICNLQSEMDLFDAIEPVEESTSLTAASAEGWVWEAKMLQPGFSLNRDPATGLPRYYPPEFVREAAPLLQLALELDPRNRLAQHLLRSRWLRTVVLPTLGIAAAALVGLVWLVRFFRHRKLQRIASD